MNYHYFTLLDYEDINWNLLVYEDEYFNKYFINSLFGYIFIEYIICIIKKFLLIKLKNIKISIIGLRIKNVF